MLSVISRGTLLRLGLCAVVALSVASCTTEVPLSSVSDSEVSGMWKGSNGGVVNLKANRGFTTSGIDWSNVSKGNECPQGEATTGTWAFWGSEPGKLDSSAALEKYTAGDTINLYFEEDPDGKCLINLNVTEGGSTLCVSDDIEIPCSREITFTREAAKTAP